MREFERNFWSNLIFDFDFYMERWCKHHFNEYLYEVLARSSGGLMKF